MERASGTAALLQRQSPVASGNKRAATVASPPKQDDLRILLGTDAPHGFDVLLAVRMGCRRERFSRERSDRHLTFEYLDRAIHAHVEQGRPDLAMKLVSVAIRDWPSTAITLTAGSVLRVFDEGGQLRLRFES